MLSRLFHSSKLAIALMTVLVTILPFAIGCGSKNVNMASSHDHPANPEAPQVAYETPADVLNEGMAHAEEAEASEDLHAHHAAPVALSPDGAAALTTMLDAYFAIGTQLAADTVDDVNTQAYAMLEAFHTLEHHAPAELWSTHGDHTEGIHDYGHQLADISDIKVARIAYGSLSDALNHFVAAIGVPEGYNKPVYSYVCGMAADVPQGGIWMQIDTDVRNPYFGSTMLKCHSKQVQLPIASASMSSHEHMMEDKGEHEHHNRASEHHHEHESASEQEHKHESDGHKDDVHEHEHETGDTDKGEKHEHKHENK